MTKVYLVYSMYHEHDINGEDPYTSENVERVFDSEEKAIDYIREQIKNDHERVDAVYPDDEHLIKYYPSDEEIRNSRYVMSYEYNCLTYITMNYRWVSYDVK